MASDAQRDPIGEPAGERRMLVELRPSAGVARQLQRMSSDLGQVISSAERAAERITAEARERAERRIAAAELEADRLGASRARQIADLTDGLAEQVDEVSRRSDDLMSALERQAREVEQAYATMVESLASVSAAILERGDGRRPREIEEVSLSQRREVTFRIPISAGAEPIDIHGTVRETGR